jgi:hypothetical protein
MARTSEIEKRIVQRLEEQRAKRAELVMEHSTLEVRIASPRARGILLNRKGICMKPEVRILRFCSAGILLILLGALTLGQVCPTQQYSDPGVCPMIIDPNMLGVDPVSGEPDLIGCYTVDVGHMLTVDGWICDDDGDAMTMTASGGGTLTMVTAASYVYRYTPQKVGLSYHHIAVTDQPMEHQTPLTRTGTIVIAAVQPNRPPAIGCGSRP